MAEKEQFMISVEKDARDRMDALRVVGGVSRAEIGRVLIEQNLHRLERAQRERLERFKAVATAHGYPHWQSLVWGLIKQSADRNSAKRGQKLPTLEELEDPAHEIWQQLPARTSATAAEEDTAPAATFSG